MMANSQSRELGCEQLQSQEEANDTMYHTESEATLRPDELHSSQASEDGQSPEEGTQQHDGDDGDEESDLAHWEGRGLDELEAPAPDESPNDAAIYPHPSLEQERRSEERRASRQLRASPRRAERSAKLQAVIYVHSYLVCFSILGVLARIGLIALTTYPGAPLITPVVWANVGGSLIMGFLREDRMLFRRHWHAELSKARKAREQRSEDTSSSSHNARGDKEAAKKAYVASRSSIHGFIGLAVGFCGTFTSFADIIRDAFLALSNDLSTAPFSEQITTATQLPRPDGYAFLSIVAVLWIELSVSLAALKLGGHLAIALHRYADRLPEARFEPYLNIAVIFVGGGAWIGGVVMAIWPPLEEWRGQAVFAVVFAPLGAILRFHLSTWFNPKIPSFPLGTFVANVFGTCVLGMVWDLQHSSAGHKLLTCQVLQGVADGFCGGLSTVSTWVLELTTLRVRHAYVYAITTLGVSIAFMVTIMGSLRWTIGFENV